jgi:hypothetical protein
MPSPCPPMMQGLAKMANGIKAEVRAKDAWARAPHNPGLGVETGPPSPDGQAHADARILTPLPAGPKVPTWPHGGDWYLRPDVPMDQDGICFGPAAHNTKGRSNLPQNPHLHCLACKYTHDRSGPYYADGFANTCHSTANNYQGSCFDGDFDRYHRQGNGSHKNLDFDQDREHHKDTYDRCDHQTCVAPPLPCSPSVLDSQLFMMELALSRAVHDWHCGFRGLVADGVHKLTEGDLWALHVPPDKWLSIIDTHFKFMLPYSCHDSHCRLGPNLGGT